MSKRRYSSVLLLAALSAATALSQTDKPAGANPPAAVEQPKYFHLDFVVKEVENGKVVNARSYAMTISTENSLSSVRAGGRIPFSQPNQTQYLDVGVNIDCRAAKQVQDQLALNVTADVSAASIEPPSTAPVIRQAKWSSNVIVPIRKPTTIFSSDDPASKKQMQLELTATLIK